MIYNKPTVNSRKRLHLKEGRLVLIDQNKDLLGKYYQVFANDSYQNKNRGCFLLFEAVANNLRKC